jgi:hypothetical protein
MYAHPFANSAAPRPLQQQLELLTDALRQRMELLHDSGRDTDDPGMGRGGGFRHVELTSGERSAKGLTEQPSALELSTVGLLEGSEAAARDADADDLRRWIESRSDTLSRFLNEPEDGAAETAWCLRSPCRDIRTAPAAGSPTFEEPASPIAAVNAATESALSSMAATIAAMAARHADSAESGSPLPEAAAEAEVEAAAEAEAEADWDTRIEQRRDCSAAGEELSSAAIQRRSGVFAGPPVWQHVDPHPHLSLDLVRALHFPLSHSFPHTNLKTPCAEQGLETISPQADWRDFLAPQEVPTEPRAREARWRLAQRLPFADEPSYADESAERINSRDDDVVGAGQQTGNLVRSGARAQLCVACFDCPCACGGAELGGGLRSASLCLVCCSLGGCSCD